MSTSARDTTSSGRPADSTQLLEEVRRRAEQAGVFGDVVVTEGRLDCEAASSAAPATYRIVHEGGAWCVALVTADRWLSESIEADLMHNGDPIEELVEEELVELDWTEGPLAVKHYRDDAMLYTFLSPIPGMDRDDAAERAAVCLLAYEAAFRELGDMEEVEESP